MKEQYRGRFVGEPYLPAARIAQRTQRILQFSCQPPIVNRFSRQFIRAAESIDSIPGETVTRVANPDLSAYLASDLKVSFKVGLKVAPTVSAHKSNKAQNVFAETCRPRLFVVPNPSAHKALEETSKSKWQNN